MDSRRSYAWQQLRAEWAALMIHAPRSVTCRRCGQPILPDEPWDLGHAVDQALGGGVAGARPEHARCNRQAGQRLGVRLRRQAAESPRAL